jgi:hypothetical protein
MRSPSNASRKALACDRFGFSASSCSDRVGDQLNGPLFEGGVKRVGVVRPIPEQPLGLTGREAGYKRSFNKGDLVQASTRRVHSYRNTRAVCHCHDLRIPLPRLVFPLTNHPFGYHVGAVAEAFGEVTAGPTVTIKIVDPKRGIRSAQRNVLRLGR